MSIATLISILILVSVGIASNILVKPIYAQEEGPYFKVEPETIELGPQSAINDTFTASIRLYNVTTNNVPVGVSGVEVHFTWNSSLVQPVSFTNKIGASGGVLNPTILYGINPNFYNATPPSHAVVPPENASYYLVSAASTGEPWWGNGTVVEITFKLLYKPTLSEGAVKFNFTLVFTDLIDASVVPVEHREYDALCKILPSPETFNVVWESATYPVAIESDSKVSVPENLALNFTGKTISFNITTGDGYINITIPKNLMKCDTPSDWTVTVDGAGVNADINGNATHTSIYIPLLELGDHTITIKSTWIVPEFPLLMLLITLVVLTPLTSLMAKKLLPKRKIIN
jgi:hypothetical protein